MYDKEQMWHKYFHWGSIPKEEVLDYFLWRGKYQVFLLHVRAQKLPTYRFTHKDI